MFIDTEGNLYEHTWDNKLICHQLNYKLKHLDIERECITLKTTDDREIQIPVDLDGTSRIPLIDTVSEVQITSEEDLNKTMVLSKGFMQVVLRSDGTLTPQGHWRELGRYTDDFDDHLYEDIISTQLTSRYFLALHKNGELYLHVDKAQYRTETGRIDGEIDTREFSCCEVHPGAGWIDRSSIAQLFAINKNCTHLLPKRGKPISDNNPDFPKVTQIKAYDTGFYFKDQRDKLFFLSLDERMRYDFKEIPLPKGVKIFLEKNRSWSDDTIEEKSSYCVIC